jgi:hypothetical protein
VRKRQLVHPRTLSAEAKLEMSSWTPTRQQRRYGFRAVAKMEMNQYMGELRSRRRDMAHTLANNNWRTQTDMSTKTIRNKNRGRGPQRTIPDNMIVEKFTTRADRTARRDELRRAKRSNIHLFTNQVGHRDTARIEYCIATPRV